ncbi:PaaX family transcriptional regulator [Dactylosporangium salmoneum]|uniref:PaaX family transcriptional regulator C-terminal domain-containing protein n=1 Tax=Dactylosporangium salmoneum TaxID=53361 RepID=A0ABN3FJK5_9ACTN
MTDAARNTRSVVFDLFGDFIRYEGGAIGLSKLCQLLAPFEVQPDAARATMTRLRTEGWFSSERSGRTVMYSLTPKGLSMLDEGRERIFNRDDAAWDGTWHLVTYQVPEDRRSVRDVLRKRLAFLGYGALAPATWVSPRDHADRVTALANELTADEPGLHLTQLTARTGSRESDREMAHRCWQLAELNGQYRDWLADWRPTFPRVHSGASRGSDALVTRVNLVRSYRRFPFADPGLPAELLPHPWHGDTAWSEFIAAYRALGAESGAWFRTVLDE